MSVLSFAKLIAVAGDGKPVVELIQQFEQPVRGITMALDQQPVIGDEAVETGPTQSDLAQDAAVQRDAGVTGLEISGLRAASASPCLPTTCLPRPQS